VGVSKGSTNPYINWKDLNGFAFEIPDLGTQREIVIVLDEIMALAEQARIQTQTQNQTLKTLKQKLLNEILG
jgi:restriction endonuclease S subunit